MNMIDYQFTDSIRDIVKKVVVPVRKISYYYSESALEIAFDRFRILFDVPTNWKSEQVDDTIAFLRQVLA